MLLPVFPLALLAAVANIATSTTRGCSAGIADIAGHNDAEDEAEVSL